MDSFPNAPQISGGALRWRDNAPYWRGKPKVVQ
ncbi:hypothetical protein NIES4103_21300 [Nostoc sp. NIES-4103]|nr:hypothetical protein NIES4103_21300 [Nostoc sp. NIES-4103]